MMFSFKEPEVSKKCNIVESSKLRKFDYKNVTNLCLIGSGTFGEVFRGTYRGEDNVIKKTLANGANASKRLVKEAQIIEKCAACPNIVDFKGICSGPLCLMLSYEVFSFRPFNCNFETSSFDKLLVFLDQNDFSGNSFNLVTQTAIQVANGVKFLHELGWFCFIHKRISIRTPLPWTPKGICIA